MNLKALYFKILFCLLFYTVIYSQNNDLTNGISNINKGRYQDAITSFQNIDTLLIKNEDKALRNFYLGYAYNLIDQQDFAYSYMYKAKVIYKALKKDDDVKDCNLQLLTILSHQNNLKDNSQTIIDELERYLSSKDKEEPESWKSD